MKTVWLRFEPAGWEIQIQPATLENQPYVELMKSLAEPHQLALELNRMREARAHEIICEVYAKTVIVCGTGPGLPSDAAGWHAWLRDHPDELEVIVLTSRVPEDWEAMADGTAADDLQELR